MHPFHLPNLDRRDVPGIEDGGACLGVAHTAVVEVARLVAVEIGQVVVEDGRPRDLVIAQRGFIDIGLERRARLALRADDVELAADGVVGVVGRPNPRQDLAVSRVGGEQRRIVDVHVREVAHAVGDRALRVLLDAEVERRMDDDAALLDGG